MSSHGSFRKKRTGKGRERGKREKQQIQTRVIDACYVSKAKGIKRLFNSIRSILRTVKCQEFYEIKMKVAHKQSDDTRKLVTMG